MVNTGSPLPEIYAALGNGLLSSAVAIFSFFSYSKTVSRDKLPDGSAYDPCTAPGADPWKRLPCSNASEKRFLAQMSGLACITISA